MRLYVIGGRGQIARSLREAAFGCGDTVLGYSERPLVDLSRPESVAKAMAEFGPDIVVNPAAYTAVDRAESEPDLAFAINRDGAAAVAAAAARLDVPIIQLSTDYVFDGSKSDPYVEGDAVNPQTVYGASKLAGERAVAKANPRHIVLRTAWVYAPFGQNFVRNILRLSAERDRLRVVDDQIGCPTYAPEIAKAIITMARNIAGGEWQPKYAGITHLAGPDALTWFAFASTIMRGAAARGGRHVPVDPIGSSDYPTPAMRPENSRLDTTRLATVFDIHLPRLQSSLDECRDLLLMGQTGERS